MGSGFSKPLAVKKEENAAEVNPKLQFLIFPILQTNNSVLSINTSETET